MLRARIVEILFIVLAAGCAGVGEKPPVVLAHSGPLLVDRSLLGQNRDGVSATQPPASVATPPASVAPVAPAKLSRSVSVIGQPVEHADPVPVTRKLEAPLDVAALKARLRDTDAIGMFTKLALKNQVDDLLQRFRALHQGGQKTGIATLRQPYDLLLLKVLALLQDSDPSLARTISGSREAIWGILADPEKFKSIT